MIFGQADMSQYAVRHGLRRTRWDSRDESRVTLVLLLGVPGFRLCHFGGCYENLSRGDRPNIQSMKRLCPPLPKISCVCVIVPPFRRSHVCVCVKPCP